MMYKLFNLNDFDKYDFGQLPKGRMLEISMNPYNGNVFLKLDKHEESGVIAYQILKQIVDSCEKLELLGFDEPLLEYCKFSDAGQIDRFVGAVVRPNVKAIKGRSKDEGSTAWSEKESKKVS